MEHRSDASIEIIGQSDGEGLMGSGYLELHALLSANSAVGATLIREVSGGRFNLILAEL
jgi:hypothetical protein